ncbi:MAG TPA: ribosome maturation factor RimM [Pyrinomonadaceae bacterium]|nr:ribosome maturation factor RimM [Pyrinomonadaceae bacterium]
MSGEPRPDAAGELIVVARVVKVRGVRGEVVAELLTDFPERFDGLAELIVVMPAGGRATLTLEGHRLHGGRILMKFAGYDSPEEASALVNCDLAVTEAEIVELGEGEFFDWQLTDCRVETIDGIDLGTVREVLHTGSAPVLVIRGGDGERDERGEHLVPLVESICVEIDTELKLIRVDAPEGLLQF